MAHEMWELYSRVAQSAALGDVRAWAKLDLTMPQLKILLILSKKEASIGHLADLLDTTMPSMTGIIDRLEKLELVERTVSVEDRRSTLVRMTPKSRELIANLYSSGHGKFEQIMSMMSPLEREMVDLGLRIFVQALERYQEEPANSVHRTGAAFIK
ncbi:transcriptional regulator-like protein [Paenibacillus larvae subsp. larvae]|uniref:Transcriptional regulator-like protein n=3 Tax=Paenibacillus larvae TaxID=1464 RepID=V9W8C7_9BACL|nr:MarR family transcriptional regulator [Paenibacillus larvae]AHD07271.1 transcriptional regulator-like protein [Paenibacillus larvae subsp. larvae DSM 25430]AQT85581.1 MarR family transcriptional regulator [Paenibacillus larvae subsp. pulvifaciens]AQZ47592.1 MarR family transcriptional regulator [Paenibacillus larvae subsp. pulvifaciens]ARF68907.1 MarR family transcriptional regulator [Paenibacillus larvae subsp. pulvifaciens]AVF24956.1 transcriptional regulator-like protein [Paenibacillus l